jgi:hypothetical protein
MLRMNVHEDTGKSLKQGDHRREELEALQAARQ